METYGADIIVYILEFLDFENLLNCKLLNHFFKRLIEDKEWHHKLILYVLTGYTENKKNFIQKHNFTNIIIKSFIELPNIYYLFDVLIFLKKINNIKISGFNFDEQNCRQDPNIKSSDIKNIFNKLNTAKKISFENCVLGNVFNYLTIDNVKICDIYYTNYTIKSLDINKKYQKLYLYHNITISKDKFLGYYQNLQNCTHFYYYSNTSITLPDNFIDYLQNCKSLTLKFPFNEKYILHNFDNMKNLTEIYFDHVTLNTDIF